MYLDLYRSPSTDIDDQQWLEDTRGELSRGDLWLLSWNGQGLGLVVITAVAESHILGWPVSLSNEEAYAPAIPIDHPLGSTLYMWPTRETGVGLHLLHRRFGQALNPTLIESIERAIEHEEQPPLPFAPPAENLDKALEHSHRMIKHWEEICFNQWPQPVRGEAPLNHQTLKDLKVKPSQIRSILNVEQIKGTAMHKGLLVPTTEQLLTLSEHLNVSPEVLTAPYLDEGTEFLMQPEWKETVVEAAHRFKTTEQEMRRRLQSEYTHAARSSGSKNDRMQAALQRLEDK